MFGNFRVADIVAFYCALADTECREELRNGILVSERDYVSALTTRIRREISRSLRLNCHAQTTNRTAESKYGVDGIIVFRFGNDIKVGLFEAKRPQVTQKNNGWDYLSPQNVSHFSEQIQKQRTWNNQIALWEMFFNEGANGFESPPYDAFGSSCVWHENAYQFMHTESLIFKPWITKKLKDLLNVSGVNFYTIIYDIISCKAGKIYKIDEKTNTSRIFSEFNDNVSLNIPIPIEIGAEIDNRIDRFLNENNLSIYTFIDLTRSEKI